MERIVIEAEIENIVYSNPDNGYVICQVNSVSEGSFYAVGYMPGIHEGEAAELTGQWVTHPEYGEQFKVELYKTVMPSDEQAIIKYLSSGTVKGVREATAKKLFAEFGNDVFNIIATEPERLAEIKGISLDRAKTISKSYNEQRSVQNIIMFLQQYGISPNLAVRVHKLLGADAVDRIKENPYTLAENVDGISFKTADAIAFGMGMPKNGIKRIRCGILYFLREAAYTGGHVYMPKNLLAEHAAYELQISDEEVENGIASLIKSRDFMLDTIDGEKVCYLYGFYYDESYIARRLAAMAASDVGRAISISYIESDIAEFEREEGITLAPLQRDAVVTALTDGCMVLTGGPGTGKTTTINTIIRLMDSMDLSVALAAPTGRAAKRMTQISGKEAKTIHRLLGAQMAGGSHIFTHDEDDPLSADVVILDEVSMIDTSLMAAFLRAVKPGGRVIFAGDSDQLPSVGAGNVLHDIISSGVVPVIRLEQIFRQSTESLIILNAHRINRGDMPVITDRTKDFFFMRRPTPESAAQTVAELYRSRLPQTYSIDPMTDVQIITPTKRGAAGTVELNRLIQQSINPYSDSKAEYKYGSVTFREGDKVMQIKNDYDMEYESDSGEKGQGIYNGDMGIINSIHTGDKYMLITFDDDRTVKYSFMSLDELDLAYAITVHKSQGSEFAYVIMPVCGYIPMLMSRNLFYTAITRAKTMVILVGSEKTIANMTGNNSYAKRFTGLNERLIGFAEKETIA